MKPIVLLAFGISVVPMLVSAATYRVSTPNDGDLGAALTAGSLSLALTTNSVSESADGAAIRATVTRDTPLTNALEVMIFNSDPTELWMPATITIPAGSNSAVFAVEPVNDGDLDGPQPVTVSVDADGFLLAEAIITVLDDDTPTRRTLGGRLFGTVATGTYLVTGNLVVESGRTLAIQPATTLQFQTGKGLTNAGTVLADASAGQEIIFTSAAAHPTNGDWQGLRVTSSGAPKTILNHVEVSYARNGLVVYPVGDYANLILSHSAIHHCSLDGVQVYADQGIVIEATAVQMFTNRIYRNQRHGISVGAYIKACNTSRNSTVVRGNEVFQNLANGVNLDAGASENSGCTGYRRSTIDSVVENNFIHGNQYGIYGFSDKGFYKAISRLSARIQNNVILNNTLGGVWLEAEPGGNLIGGELMAKLLNNTIVRNGGAGILHATNVTTGFTIANNLIVENRQGICATSVFAPTNAAVTFNDVWGNGLSNWVGYPAAYGAAAIPNANGTPADARMNISADPEFRDVEDFRLAASSPAVDAGTTNLAPLADFNGQPRRGAFDIGSDELDLTLANPMLEPGGANFQMLVIGGRGTPCWIEATTNFQRWVARTSVTLTNRTMRVTVPVFPGDQGTFYRARVQ
jgi:hypothetical protein